MEFCTCGVRVVEGARFCHKCGRPLYAEPQSEVALEAPMLTVAATDPKLSAPAEINFRNTVAVRVGFLVAGLGIFVNNLAALFRSVPLQLLAFIGLSMASGVFAVWLYMRRTGQPLTVRSGARLGWITGVFSFVIVTVITTLSIAMIGPDKLTEVYRDSIATGGMTSENLDRLFANPAAVITALGLALAALFTAYTVAASVGGAVGAKLLHKGRGAGF